MSLFSGQIGSLEQALRVKDMTSPTMREAIARWETLYLNAAQSEQEDSCQRLPVLIVSKLCRTVFSEYAATVLGEGPRQDWLREVLRRLEPVRERAVQFQLTGGECFIKPVLAQGGAFDFLAIPRSHFLPLARDLYGRITDAATLAMTLREGWYYTLAERRTVDTGGALTIRSHLYRSRERGNLGTEVPLNALEEYAALAPELVLPEVYSLGMAQLRTPLLNCVDGSTDGVSVFAPAEALLHRLAENERQLAEEFENGASRVFASADLLTRDARGRRKLSERLFVGIDEEPAATGVTIFSPALREQSYLARKQEYLRDVESLIGLKRGILSEVEAAERTATEITSSAGDYNLTIIDFQRTWENSLRELLDICLRLGRLYYRMEGGPLKPEELSIDWGDGVLFNRDKAWAEQLQMVQAGMLRPELALGWYYNLPTETPEDLRLIREKFLPELDRLAEGG